MDTPDEAHETGLRGLRLFRRQHEATLGFGDRRAEVRFVHDGRTGRLVMPVEPPVLTFAELVLYAPFESDQELQITGSPQRVERPESEEAVDRWGAYHGRTTLSAWAWVTVEGAKSGSEVWGGDELMRPNPLLNAEGRLLRPLNSDRDRLGRLCRTHAGVEVLDPMAVGVDPWGVDVRARFGILRLEFPAVVTGAEEAAGAIAGLLEPMT